MYRSRSCQVSGEVQVAVRRASNLKSFLSLTLVEMKLVESLPVDISSIDFSRYSKNWSKDEIII